MMLSLLTIIILLLRTIALPVCDSNAFTAYNPGAAGKEHRSAAARIRRRITVLAESRERIQLPRPVFRIGRP